MILSRRSVALVTCTTAVLGGCASENETTVFTPVPIVATTSIWADIASNVTCGELVPALIPAGADPHTFEPSLRDRELIDGPAAIIANGGGLEGLVGALLEAPVITGQVPVRQREALFEEFRTGRINRLVVSKVANFSVDLPEAGVAIQISGTFGSRQEEAQRLGRVLRPKADGRTAHFYTVVTRDTVDADFAAHRQRFLAEQGYAYRIVDADDVFAGEAQPPTA